MHPDVYEHDDGDVVFACQDGSGREVHMKGEQATYSADDLPPSTNIAHCGK